MKKLVSVAIVIALMAVAVSAMAATAKAPKPRPPRVSGVVASLQHNAAGKLASFSLKTAAIGDKPAETVTINVTPNTRYLLGTRPVTAGALKAGAAVRVSLAAALKDAAGTAVAVRIAVPRPAGSHRPRATQ